MSCVWSELGLALDLSDEAPAAGNLAENIEGLVDGLLAGEKIQREDEFVAAIAVNIEGLEFNIFENFSDELGRWVLRRRLPLMFRLPIGSNDLGEEVVEGARFRRI